MPTFASIAQFAIASSTGSESFVLSTTSGTYALSMHGAAKLISDIYPSGSYVLNGRSMGLNVGNIITAENATYTLSGTTAETETRLDAANILLDRNYGLVANNASYATTLQSVDLKKGFGIGADAGSFTVAYNDINANVRFAAPTASFLLFGQPAFKGIGEGFDAGTFATTTQDATLVYGRNIYPTEQKYTLTGNEITIRGFLSPVVPIETYTEKGPEVTEIWTEQVAASTTTWTEVA